MLNDIKKDATTRMTKSVDGFRQELTKLRTGRATTALVDHLKVNYYGSDMPLSQVATVAVADARSLQQGLRAIGLAQHGQQQMSRFDVGVVIAQRQGLGFAQGFLEFGGEFVESHGHS